jgi:hypothetical protein
MLQKHMMLGTWVIHPKLKSHLVVKSQSQRLVAQSWYVS